VNTVIVLILLLLLLATAVVIVRLQDLFAAAMLTGIFSLVSAGLFTLMDAVDVAFTEAAVGAGISTILIIGTLSMTSRREHQQPLRLLPFVVVLVTGAVLVAGTLDMPAYGDPAAPAHQHELYEGFITQTAQDFEHIPNVVTVILASFRGYDTFGETTVVFAAAVGVFLLLGGRRRRRATGLSQMDTAPTDPPVDFAPAGEGEDP
jgi:multicomponent Na+:H+ antiporter subunit B